MIEIIESKISDIVCKIIEKPVEEIKKEDYDILSSELYRQKSKIESEAQGKRMTELLANMWVK